MRGGMCSFRQNSFELGGIILAVFSILAQYELPIMSYGIILILIYCFGILLFNNKELYINKTMFIFILFSLVQQFFVYLLTGTLLKNKNTYLFMLVSLFILALAGHINSNCFTKIYYVIGIACSTIVIYQFIMGIIWGIPQSAIQILPVTPENQHYWIENSNRVSGLFTEPQGFCSYIIPLLVILVFSKRFTSAVFISIAIFASTSSQGIILMAVVWAAYFPMHGKNTTKKYLKIIAMSFFGLTLIFTLSNIEQFSFIFDKIKSINLFAYDIRLTKGFQIYFAMPLEDKIAGIGFENLNEYLRNGSFNFIWMTLTRDDLFAYITTMSNILVSFGILGFFFYLNIFIKNKTTNNEIAKVMLLIIFISSFTQTILFNAWYLFYWILFEVFDEKDDLRYLTIRYRFKR